MAEKREVSALELHGFTQGRLSCLKVELERWKVMQTTANNEVARCERELLEALSGHALSQERMLNVEASTRLLAAMTGKDKK